jgi:hypothetical protein
MTRLLAGLDPRKSATLSLVFVGLVFAATLGRLEPRGFWIIDNANKFLQLQSIVDSGYRDYSIPWPGVAVDPDFEFNPFPPQFASISDGKLYSSYPPAFALVSSLPYRALGMRGLYLLPLVAGLTLLAGVAGVARRLGASPPAEHLAVLFAGLCTPVWFYSVVFWEHTIAAAFAVLSVERLLAFSVRPHGRTLVVCGLFAAIGGWFRDDQLLLCPAIVVLVFIAAPERRVRAAGLAAVSMLAGLLPLWLFNISALGRPLGFHFSGHGTSLVQHLADRATVARHLFLSADPSLLLTLALGLPFLAVFLRNPRRPQIVPLLALVGLACGSVWLVRFVTTETPIYQLLNANGFFISAPLLILAWRRPVEDLPGRRLWLLALVFFGLYLALAPGLSSRGVHWGNRFFLPFYALFAAAAAVRSVEWLRGADRGRRWGIAAIGALIAISLAAQLYSIRLLDAKKSFTYELNRVVGLRPEPVIVTDVWWLPQYLYTTLRERPVFYVASAAAVQRLTGRLREAGYESFLAIVQRPPTRPGDVVVDDGMLNYFFVTLQHSDL